MPTDESFWDKIAERYDQTSQNKGPNYAARLERVKAVCTDSDSVLDVGCASGEITLDTAPHVGRIRGIDLSGKQIEMASTKAKERSIDNASFDRLNVMDPSLPPGSFDIITTYSVFHLVEDVSAVIRRMNELLAPGGHLISETPCLGDRGWHFGPLITVMRWIGKAPRVVHRLKAMDLEAMIRDTGFEILDSQVYNPKSRQHCILARKTGGSPD